MRNIFISLIAVLLLAGVGCGNKNHNTVTPVPAEQKPKLTTNILVQAPPKVTTLSLYVNKKLPKYTFRLTNISSSSPAHVDIFRGLDKTPSQVITLDPAVFVRMSDDLPFATEDVNFDGYMDIGVLADGGAKWGAFQYWTYNKTTGTFVTTTYTQLLTNIGYNGVKFDQAKKQIITSNFYGTGPQRDIYQYANGELKSLESAFGENIYQDPTNRESTTTCKITIIKYNGDKSGTTTKMLPYECPGNYFGF